LGSVADCDKAIGRKRHAQAGQIKEWIAIGESVNPLESFDCFKNLWGRDNAARYTSHYI
jgi:hypothetical protein